MSWLRCLRWPLVARAQQPVPPVVGFLSAGSVGSAPGDEAAFAQGLKESGPRRFSPGFLSSRFRVLLILAAAAIGA
jgi:hypothetical protein